MLFGKLKTPAELEDLYHPVMAEIKEVKRLTGMETFYRIELPGGKDLGHVPGQFVELSVADIERDAPRRREIERIQRGSELQQTA